MIDYDYIRTNVPLVPLVQACGIQLRQEGQNWRAKCPFHQEKQGASLIVYPDNRWYCHGKCGRGGDVLSFYLAIRNYSDLGSLITEMLIERLSGRSSARFTKPVSIRPPEHRLASKGKWPEPEIGLIEEIVRQGIGLADLAEKSPCTFADSLSHTEEIIDSLFPDNPRLCVGIDNSKFATRRREIWRGHLSRMPLIVANPMSSVWGNTQGGRQSQHSLEATAIRVYLPIEFDFSLVDKNGERTVLSASIEGWQRDHITIADACAALHLYLAKSLPLVLAVHSGGKSLHAWFRVLGFDDKALLDVMRRACRIGADHVTWTPSQFVRMPDGTRQDGTRQVLYYFDPEETVYGSRSPLCSEKTTGRSGSIMEH